MLFEPFVLSGLTLKNRIVRSATYEKRADEDGYVTDGIIELYRALAAGGAGLIITGNALVHPSGRTVPRMLCAHSASHVEGLRRLAGAVHDAGGIVALQLVHGGRQSAPVLLGGEPPLAPSEVMFPLTRTTPRAMTDAEVWMLIDAFGEAAWRARSAGLDAVQLHAAHGYLISQFLSPYTNRRDDYWGGDEERRFHFLEEVMRVTRDAVGPAYPVLAKVNSEDFLPGGLSLDDGLRIARRLAAAGVDAVEISGGMIESSPRIIRPGIERPEDEAYFRLAGAAFKRAMGIPVIVTGGMRTRAVMEDVLARGEADLIGMSRPLIREPDLPRLMREGKAGADCSSCNLCTQFLKSPRVLCAELDGASRAGP